jgi:probable rRNA maturation factor
VPDGERPRLAGTRKLGGAGDPEVFVADEQEAVPIDASRWAALAEAILQAEGVRGHAELSLIFVDETGMSELNEQFLGASGPTDVLAFPIDATEVEVVSMPGLARTGPDRSPVDPDDLPLLLGDIVVCPAVAARHAPDHARTLDDELALLVVHGVLHVLGHDHADPAAAEAMRARERELLQAHHWNGPVPTDFRQEQPS